MKLAVFCLFFLHYARNNEGKFSHNSHAAATPLGVSRANWRKLPTGGMTWHDDDDDISGLGGPHRAFLSIYSGLLFSPSFFFVFPKREVSFFLAQLWVEKYLSIRHTSDFQAINWNFCETHRYPRKKERREEDEVRSLFLRCWTTNIIIHVAATHNDIIGVENRIFLSSSFPINAWQFSHPIIDTHLISLLC